MKDRRKPAETVALDPQLVNVGTAQLTQEIKVIENWLEDLRLSKSNDIGLSNAEKTYLDMLRSRKEMLKALSEYDSL